ncbi:hypothetical protein DXG01_008519 [Tephrocybe rancida]|nr:hypothetical protein DXG01_008519 [Tephrocybe rancida]
MSLSNILSVQFKSVPTWMDLGDFEVQWSHSNDESKSTNMVSRIYGASWMEWPTGPQDINVFRATAGMNDGTVKEIVFKIPDDDEDLRALHDKLEFQVALGSLFADHEVPGAPRCLGLYETIHGEYPYGILVVEYCGERNAAFPTEDTVYRDSLVQLVFKLHRQGVFHGRLWEPARLLNMNDTPYIVGFNKKDTFRHRCYVDTSLIKKGVSRPPPEKECDEIGQFLSNVGYCLEHIEWMGRLHTIRDIGCAAHIFELPCNGREAQVDHGTVPEKWHRAVEKWKEMLATPEVYFHGVAVPELGIVDYSVYLAKKEADKKKADEKTSRLLADDSDED